ncbi:hypothetical protein D1007_49233 [Hordeum vulgare]|nr:hypothetical protein D1007_49233 [Hordeum vulgare]
MFENSRDLDGELCILIMSIDDIKSLDEEWVLSSKPYPISISLKKTHDILKTDQAMDCKSFNLAVHILACYELLMLKDTPDYFMDLIFCEKKEEEEEEEEEPEQQAVPMAMLDSGEDDMELLEDKLALVVGLDMEDVMAEFTTAQAEEMAEQQAIPEYI